jgi:secreted trypsin-like serine protease
LGFGTLAVNSLTPRLTVTGFLFGGLSSGTAVFKVGRTTGGTFGAISNTCLDINVNLSTKTMLCQDRVGAGSDNGDSGAPVFTQSGGEATLAGILWGGSGGKYVYSPWLYVVAELGGLIPNAP